MAELYQMYADKQSQIESVVNGLLTSGMISMEEANELESLVPGEIQNLDPNIIFDLDPSNHGSKIALEAALAGLDKIKIAFIVAVVAFILRYISSLHKSAGYSFSGGSGGGWGGSAPTEFKSNAKPVSTRFSSDVANHQNLLVDDFKMNHDKFMEQLDKFTPWGNNAGHLKSLKSNKSFKRFVEVTIKDILNRNKHQDDHGNIYFFSEGTKPVSFVEYAEGRGLEDKNLANLPKVLSLINEYYNPKAVFSVNYSKNKIQIPPFVLSENLITPALEFIKQVTVPVSKLQEIEADVSSFISKINLNKTVHLRQQTEDVVGWISGHFILQNNTIGNASATSKLGETLSSICLIPVPGITAYTTNHQIAIFDTMYLDTNKISNHIKNMIKVFTASVVDKNGATAKADDDALNKLTREYFEAVTKGDADKVDKVTRMDQFIPVIESFNELLENGYKDFENLQEIIQEFIQLNAEFKNQGQGFLDSKTDEERNSEEQRHHRALNSFIVCLDLTYNAVIALSSCFAGVATIGAQIQKFEVAKIKQVIGELNEMNKHYFDLTQDLIRINEAHP
jgi:hypothetical protein